MKVDVGGAQSHAYVVDTLGADRSGQLLHLHALRDAYSIDRVVMVPGSGADLDGHPGPAVIGQKVDLTAIHGNIGREDAKPVILEKASGQLLPETPHSRALVSQSFNSDFSNSSTFTSRKVRTCTCSRKRAGRNMSQTQASFISTSK